MHLNIAHTTGWLIIVVAVLMFIGEAYASPTGAFEQWERSVSVRWGDGVGAGSRIQASGGPTGPRAHEDAPMVTRPVRPGDYLEDAVRPDSARPLEWRHEGETLAVDSEPRGPEAERELSPGGIWDGRDDDREEPSDRARAPHGHDPDAWDR